MPRRPGERRDPYAVSPLLDCGGRHVATERPRSMGPGVRRDDEIHVARGVSLHRGVDQVSQHRADIFALAWALHHEHREHVFGGIDPEERSGHPAPEELTGRSRERRHALMVADGEAEAEAVT